MLGVAYLGSRAFGRGHASWAIKGPCEGLFDRLVAEISGAANTAARAWSLVGEEIEARFAPPRRARGARRAPVSVARALRPGQPGSGCERWSAHPVARGLGCCAHRLGPRPAAGPALGAPGHGHAPDRLPGRKDDRRDHPQTRPLLRPPSGQACRPRDRSLALATAPRPPRGGSARLRLWGSAGRPGLGSRGPAH